MSKKTSSPSEKPAEENEIQKFIIGKDIKSFSANELAVPQKVQDLFSLIKGILPQKRKITARDILPLIEGQPSKEDIAEKISAALKSIEKNEALSLWDSCSKSLQHDIIMPDKVVVDVDIIYFLEVPGVEIRQAFLSKRAFNSPQHTAYSIAYGEIHEETGSELVHVLEDIMKTGPEGKAIVDEFFKEIDPKLLYLISIAEIEQYIQDDGGGDDVRIALKTSVAYGGKDSSFCGSEMPIGVPFMAWLQRNKREHYKELASNLLDPTHDESRALFWELFMRNNNPQVDSEHFNRKQEATYRSKGVEDFEDTIDNHLRRIEGD